MKIEWIISGSDPELVKEDNLTGGFVYENYIRDILRNIYKLDIIYLFRGNHNFKIFKALQFFRYILKNLTLKFNGEIIIRDMFSTVFAPFDKRRKNIVVLHHLDISNVEYKSLYNMIEKRFFKRVRYADKVVVVSEYWKNILENLGCSNVVVIYNPFDLNMFDFEPEDLLDFQRKLGIDEAKPIIYLGNTRPEKGYIESYEALKDLDVIFVATGRKKANLPIFQYYLSYSDYLKILKISTLTITMSKFNEGWCRTAHESMLCGTPVIGSGRGGMRELLEKGGQFICDDFKKIKSFVSDLLSDRKKLEIAAIEGREYSDQFTLKYFKESWINLISSF